jgi:hypothetical protein
MLFDVSSANKKVEPPSLRLLPTNAPLWPRESCAAEQRTGYQKGPLEPPACARQRRGRAVAARAECGQRKPPLAVEPHTEDQNGRGEKKPDQ